MKHLITFSLLFSTLSVFGQDIIFNKLSSNDSIKLMQTWNFYISAIETKDSKTIKSLSLPLIDCELCITEMDYDNPIPDAFVKIDTFTLYLYDSLLLTKLWKVIKSTMPTIESVSFKDFHQRSLKLKKGEYFTRYELNYILWKANEYAQGHEGGNFIFQFVKIKDKFRLFGITSVP